MKIDIRNQEPVITEIEFAEKRNMWKTATRLSHSRQGIVIASGTAGDVLLVHNDTDLDNLIKALQKAKELKWTVGDV